MARPHKIADILSDLIAKRGYTRRVTGVSHAEAWRQAAGEQMSQFTRVGPIRRGVLEVTVANSTLVQELTFQKRTILQQLADLLPTEKIADLRCRVGPIE